VHSRLIKRIGLFAALIYVISWGTLPVPNVKPAFFIIFSAGYLWGLLPGFLVGAIGMGLWTFFNPFGPAPLPIAAAQVLCAGLCGILGFNFRRLINPNSTNWQSYFFLIAAGVICTLVFFVPVSAVDAWLFQPFRERFIASMFFTIYPLVANILIFPLLFRLLRPFYVKEFNLQ
ncbi:MAG: ECF transporter S component, partial [Candidatus Zixiibacteriota bacterium]